MKTVGVDLAADPANTALCSIDWTNRTVELLERPFDDDDIVDAIAGCDMAGIDVPLGWPDDFVEAVVAHRDRSGWPPIALPPPSDRERLRFRDTDRVVRAGGARPLSVSTDLIGVAAMRGARLQRMLIEAGVAVDRSGTSGKVLEAYPAAALRAWGLTSSGYKGTKNREVCRLLVDKVIERCGVLAPEARSCLDGCNDDDLDAFLCAVIARAAELGHTTRPTADQLEIARSEGWIYVPTVGLEEITSGP